MFPYHDENITLRTPLITYLIAALNVLAWFVVQGAGSPLELARSVCDLGLIPGELTLSLPPGTRFPMGDGLVCLTDPGRQVSHVFTSMFLHGGWMHVLGNMWFLWIFGDNIEDILGHGKFLLFYLLCGIAAALLQVVTNPRSAIPMVGASGAISGVLGAYLLLYPRVRVHVLVFLGFFVTTIVLPAYLMLGYWALLQVLGGLPSLGGRDVGGVAYFAHIGGFLAGILLIRLFIRKDYHAPPRDA